MEEPQTVEQEAQHLGWVSKEEFKGNPERWVDAESFVRRGKELMPILRKNNEALQGQVGRLEAQLQETRSILAQHTESMEAMKELQKKSVKEAIQRTRAELKQSLVTARENGDVEAELEINDHLSEVTSQLKELDKAPVAVAKAPETQPVADPDTQAWMSRNKWYEEDPAMQGLVLGLGQKIRNDPRTSALIGRAFFDKLDEMLEDYRPSRQNSTPKVEGSRSSGGGGGGQGGKSYASLPQDAKAECDKEASKFVGEGKAFKSKADWQAHFAQLYWGEE